MVWLGGAFVVLCLGRSAAGGGAFGRRQGAATALPDFADASPPPASVPRPFSAADDARFLPVLRRGALRSLTDHNGNLWKMELELPAAAAAGGAARRVTVLFRRMARMVSQDDEEHGEDVTSFGTDTWWTDATHDVAAFFLDRMLGLYRAAPTAGRCFDVSAFVRAQDSTKPDNFDFEWSAAKRGHGNAPDGLLEGVMEPPGTRGKACGSVTVMVPGLTSVCPALNKALCHSGAKMQQGVVGAGRAGAAAAATTGDCGAAPTAWQQLAEMSLFDFVLANADRFLCTFKASELDENHQQDWSQQRLLEAEADGLWMLNMHCVARGALRAGAAGAAAVGAAGAGAAGAGAAARAPDTLALVDNGTWLPLVKPGAKHRAQRREQRERRGREWWGGLFEGGCALHHSVRARLRVLAAAAGEGGAGEGAGEGEEGAGAGGAGGGGGGSFSARFNRIARGDELFPLLAPAVLARLEARLQEAHRKLRACVPNHAAWLRALARQHKLIVASGQECA